MISYSSRIAVCGGLIVLSGCSVLMNTEDVQCKSDADCAARGFSGATCVNQVCTGAGAAGPWACLGSVAWPSSGDTSYPYKVTVVDVITLQPPANLQVRACPKLDVECSSPLNAPAGLNGDGQVEATLPAGFDGYLELTSPDITPALLFVTKPVWEDTVVQSIVPVVSPAGFEGIAQAVGTTLNLVDMGHTYALASDCQDAPAEGVRLEIDKKNAQTTGYYMINNAPVATAPSTDAAGSGGFLNLDPGFAKITGFVAASGARIGDTSFVVRKGAVSYPRVMPTP